MSISSSFPTYSFKKLLCVHLSIGATLYLNGSKLKSTGEYAGILYNGIPFSSKSSVMKSTHSLKALLLESMHTGTKPASIIPCRFFIFVTFDNSQNDEVCSRPINNHSQSWVIDVRSFSIMFSWYCFPGKEIVNTYFHFYFLHSYTGINPAP